MKNSTKIQCIHLHWLHPKRHKMPRVFIQLTNADESNNPKQIITYNQFCQHAFNDLSLLKKNHIYLADFHNLHHFLKFGKK